MYHCNDFIGRLKLGTNSSTHLKIRAYAFKCKKSKLTVMF